MVLLVSCSVARNDSFTCSCGVETARNASEKRANARRCGALSRSRRHRLDQERIDAPLALLSLSRSLPRSLPRSHVRASAPCSASAPLARGSMGPRLIAPNLWSKRTARRDAACCCSPLPSFSNFQTAVGGSLAGFDSSPSLCLAFLFPSGLEMLLRSLPRSIPLSSSF